MNTKATTYLGWGSCFFGVMGGASYGIYLGKEGNNERDKVGRTRASCTTRSHGLLR